MKVITRRPPPQPEPPATYDIVGIAEWDMQVLMEVSQKSSYIGSTFAASFGRRGSADISDVLNRLYHAIVKEMRIK